MDKILEKLKFLLKRNAVKNDYTEAIYKAKTELADAERSFNEITDANYMDVAILNLNLARRKYELCIAEAKSSYKAS